MNRCGAALLAALLALPMVGRTETPAPARAEIDVLLDQLERSGCQFHRNGDWHSAREARAHLTKKLQYLETRDLVHTAEDFIRLGASQSSVSGETYQVRCADTPPVTSGKWLTEALHRQRAGDRP